MESEILKYIYSNIKKQFLWINVMQNVQDQYTKTSNFADRN